MNLSKIFITKPFKNIGTLRYFGTRIGLDQEALKVWVYDKTGLLPGSATLIGAGDLPLLGAANGGTLSARLCWEMPKSKGKIATERLHDSGEVRGTVDVDSSHSPLWREFAQIGDLNPPELRIYPPFWYSYLCIKVVSASNLIGADDSGVSDPYFVCSLNTSWPHFCHLATDSKFYAASNASVLNCALNPLRKKHPNNHCHPTTRSNLEVPKI